jgi:glutamate-1-semialdehyde 2,1-aminomutase
VSDVDRAALARLSGRERARFADLHPQSRALSEEAGEALLGGVPMNWMRSWPGEFPLFADHAVGATVTDVDGITYDDFCLGDTGAMCGHSPAPTVAAVVERVARGITMMLPTEDAAWVGRELRRRFGLPWWQIAMSATDANRFALRIARAVTGRPVVVVFDWCYHGTVDETLAALDEGRTVARRGTVGAPVDPGSTTRVVPWNDVDALRRALAPGDVAAVLAEPALTNIGIVLPAPGLHDALRALTREHGALLVIDETHTICAGPGGATRAWGLEPDLLTIGKPIGGGVPAAAYGMTAALAADTTGAVAQSQGSDSGIGGTLSGNALALAAIRATLGEVLTDTAFAAMDALGARWTEGVQATIDRHRLRWHVTRLGCRAEYAYGRVPRDGAAAAAAAVEELDAYLHLFCLNEGILLTPFHNMALMSPATSTAMVDHHTDVFAAAVAELVAADVVADAR